MNLLKFCMTDVHLIIDIFMQSIHKDGEIGIHALRMATEGSVASHPTRTDIWEVVRWGLHAMRELAPAP